jgi:hypothetical protein
MATVVDLLAKFRADSSQFTANISKARADIEAFEKAVGSGSRNINQGLDSVNKRSVAIGAAIGTAIGQVATQAFMKAGHAAKQFFVDSVKGASDLNESTTKTEAVFGGATDIIMKFADGAATAIGQSKQQALDAAATFGIYGRSAGLAGQELADFAMTQTALASDLASFYNKTPEEAIMALGAAFRGQSEPARAFGILMDDMSMRAAAFKMGIISSTKEALTPQNKVLAANAIILEKSKVAQGDFAKTSAGLANQQRILAAQVANTKTQFGQALLPTVLSVVAAFNTKVVPAFTGLAGSFKTLVEEIAGRLAPTFANLKTIIGNIITAVTPLATIVGGLLAIGFVTVTNTLNVLLPIVASITGFFAENKAILIGVATAVGLVTAAVVGATIAFKIQTAVVKGLSTVMKVFQVVQLLVRRGQLATIASTNGLAASMLALNATLRANPIGAVVTVIALLVAGFVLAWKKSETFRNVVAKAFEVVANVVLLAVKAILGYIKMMVNGWMNVAGFILDGAEKAFGWIPGIGDKVKGANKAFDGLQTGVNATFDKIIAGAEGMKNKVVNAVKGAAAAEGNKKGKGKGKPKDKPKPGDVPAAIVDPAGVKDAADKYVSNMKEIVQDYNDFIENDFAAGFTSGSEKARDTILKGIDLAKKAFEDAAKVDPKNAKNIMKAFDQMNDRVRGMIPNAQKVAAELQAVSEKLDDAKKALDTALADRAAGAKKLTDVLASRFGEPSELNKVLNSATATVDGVIGMYDNLVDAVNQRFAGIDPSAKDAVIKNLQGLTDALVTQVRKREAATKKLETAQKSLDDLLAKQAEFRNSTTDSLKSYAMALADISGNTAAATISVTKTATGLVISQTRTATNAVDTITKQMQDRLKGITDFSNNINALLSKGLDRKYIEQLLGAGPEAAGETAKALNTASADQLATINSLYSSIDSASTTFGDAMATTFYDNAVKMAQGIVTGAESQLAAINTSMKGITNDIENALAPLRSLGTNIGTDLAQGLYDKLLSEKARLVALAESIAQAIAAAMASALAGIGVGGVSSKIGSGNSGTFGLTAEQLARIEAQRKETEALKKRTEELNAARKKAADDRAARVAKPPVGKTVYNPLSGTFVTGTSTATNLNDAANAARIANVNVTINKNIEDAAIEGIMNRSILNALRAV